MNDDTEPKPESVDIRHQVREAMLLLEHAIDSGYKREDGTTVPDDVIRAIKTTAAALGIADVIATLPPQLPGTLPAERKGIPEELWIAFELAYYKLSIFMSPITARTLLDTCSVGRRSSWHLAPAQSFSRWLWLVAIGFAVFVVLGEWGMQYYGPVQDGIVDWENAVMQLVQILTPYGYGGLGSCVYLLRSAHRYIHERTFDTRRKPEYFNRVLLGTISGGAIILFVEQITTDNGEVIKLSSGALGFLAGYSTDFLFNTFERIISAILPKTGLDSVRRQKTPPPAKPPVDPTLKDLMDRFEKATDPDQKSLYKSLIEKMRDRL